MSNTCFKRKLMSVVDDSSLDKLGEIKIVVPAGVNKSYQIGCVNGKSIQIYSDSPVLSLDGSTYVDSITISSNSVRWWLKTTEETVINIINKYYLFAWGDYSREGLGWIDLSVFEYSINMQSINVGNQNGVTGDTKVVKKLPLLTYFTCPTSTVGHLSDFKDCTNITNLNLTKHIVGDIKELGHLKKLTGFGVFLAPELTGNIEEFVATQRGAGRTDGRITGTYMFNNCNVYFNGAKITNESPQTGVLTWTATTITLNDVTIDNDDVIIPE